MKELSGDPNGDRYYHGTRNEYKVGDLILLGNPPGKDIPMSGDSCLFLTRNTDEAIWDAELSDGEKPERVYIVEPTGRIEIASDLAKQKSGGRPTMSIRTFEPLRVIGEVTEWRLYHGTRADLKPGDLIIPGYTSNFGTKQRSSNYVYFSQTLDAAMWGAELAAGESVGRIYVIEPTGSIENDPNLTDKKFRGNPTKSFRSRLPLRVISEILDWQGHPPEAVQLMKEGLKKLEMLGAEADDNLPDDSSLT